MTWLVTLLAGTICVGGVILINRFIIDYEDEQPDGWCNPWTTLDKEQIEDLEFRQLSIRRFEIRGKSRLFSMKSGVILTITTEKSVLNLLIQQADSPLTNQFLYQHTDEQGNFEFKFTAPSGIDKIVLKDSGHELWRRSQD